MSLTSDSFPSQYDSSFRSTFIPYPHCEHVVRLLHLNEDQPDRKKPTTFTPASSRRGLLPLAGGFQNTGTQTISSTEINTMDNNETSDNIETSVQSIFHRIFESDDIVLRPEMS